MKITLKRIEDGDVKVWQVRCWRNGRYDRKQFRLLEDAQEYRKQLEDEADESKRVEVPEQDRHMVWTSYQRARVGGYTLTQACDFFERSLLMKVDRLSLKEASDGFLAAKRAKRLRQRSMDNLESRMTHLCAKLGETTSVHDITLTKLQGCIEKEWSPRSIINFRLVASNFFGWCVAKRHCLENIGAQLEEPLTEDHPPVILTPDEVRAMLEEARRTAPHIVPFVAISVFAGVRNQELLRLQWSDIDFNHNVIRIDSYKAKTRARRLVTMQPNLIEWLKLGGSLPPQRYLYHWKRIRPERYQVDAMRRTFCSYHLTQFGSAAQTAIQAGHSEPVLFSHYRGLVSQQDAKTFWNIAPQ